MEVLYISGIGQSGGASRSLLELVSELKLLEIEPHFIFPRGNVQAAFTSLTDSIWIARGLSRFDNTMASHYRGARWLVLIREILRLPGTAIAIWRATQHLTNTDVIHINEILDLPSGLIAKAIMKRPLIVHVRSKQHDMTKSWRGRLIKHILKRHADALIAIDGVVRSSLPDELNVDVIHNSFSPNLSRPKPKLPSDRASIRIGFVGNILHSKGILDLVKAVSLLRKRGHKASLVIAGGRLRNLQGPQRAVLKLLNLESDALPEVVRLIEEDGLNAHVELIGYTNDISQLYSKIDVLAFPSYLDAPGRPIFEAAFFSVPCITCISQPTDDTFVPNETGLSVPPGDAHSLASAIEYFLRHPSEIDRMGKNALLLAQKFSNPKTNAAKVADLYKRIGILSR